MAKIRLNKRKEYKEQLRLFINLSNNVRKRIRKHFREYADLAENLYNNIGQVPSEYYDDYYLDMFTILSDNARQVIITTGNRLERTRIVKKSDNIDSVILDYTNTQTARNVTNITETTRKAIQAQITLGLDTGLSNPQISKNIKKSTGFSAKRATLIARTETHQAMNYGNQSVAKRLGLKKPVKEWASAMDERARSWHVSMNGVQVGIDEPFRILTPVAGGAIVEKQLQYAGDANGGATNTINCRCFVLYYDADDITDDASRRPPIIEEIPEPPIKEMNATSLANPIKGSAVVVTKSKRELKDEITKLSTGGLDDKYLKSRYRGDINKGKSYFDDWNEEELTDVTVLLKEANEIAQKHKIPRLQGTQSVGRSRALAMMGDGILYFNAKYIKQKTIGQKDREKSDFMVGKTKLKSRYDYIELKKRQDIGSYAENMWFTSEGYVYGKAGVTSRKNLSKEQVRDLLLDDKRSTIYHEMGHHIHQQTKALTGDGNIEDSLKVFFNKAVRQDNKLLREQGITKMFPTRYSTSNSQEWFAENFSLYQLGIKNKVSPVWLEYYEKEILSRI
tara:strand:+ start:18132 stop:19823 length:1692 start_codon:yes stop_codon:yes gene_type:complete